MIKLESKEFYELKLETLLKLNEIAKNRIVEWNKELYENNKKIKYYKKKLEELEEN